ncbi:MAG: RimJ/RimL family protein N-acetyltransferase [Maribacter sp.]|jgi:RimJ/RimL family protein N-acetyltransferase
MNKFPYHIRPIEMADVEKYLSLMKANKERLYLYFPIATSQVKNLNTAVKYIKSKLIDAREKRQFVFVIEHLQEQYLAGYLIVKNLDWESKECELAYWLGEGYEGQGIMSYSIQQIIGFCFQYLALEMIYLRIDPINNKSKILAQRNDFNLARVHEKEYRRGDNVWVDVEYWELNNELKID